ncbi:MAG: carboxypeptidase family protein [Chlamydiia bacterium]|nr:carboxypeptidase family protein [Chlamydiia bacterium]
MNKIFYTFLICSFGLMTQPYAQEPAATPATNKKEAVTEKIVDDVVKQSHTMSIKGTRLSYESITGTLTVKNEEGKESAHIFYTAYFLKDTTPGTRPITFCFNGGPGSSSIWLHMGLLGPKKVVFKDLGVNPPPGKYENNPYTLLDQSDLVFVDPVSTGFSTPVNGVEAKQFYGVEEDIASIANFIQQFTTKYNRWGSPKFLLGESYGTLRAVGLADKLYSTYFMNVNGLILVSSCLDFQTSGIDSTNDLSYALSLPSFTATAWYHKKLAPQLQDKKLQEVLNDAEHFALNEYATALLLGDSLPVEKKAAIAEKLASFTGLPLQYVMQSNLRIRDYRFMKNFLQSEEKVIGRFDSRYTGADLDPIGSFSDYDPSMDAVAGNYISAFQEYLREDLHFEKDSPYYILNRTVHPWNWEQKNRPSGMGYLSLAEHLQNTMVKNPSMHVFIASGHYDLATPYFAADYTINHLHLNAKLRGNIHQYYYDAGHMMYLHEPSLVKLKSDLTHYLQTSLKK